MSQAIFWLPQAKQEGNKISESVKFVSHYHRLDLPVYPDFALDLDLLLPCPFLGGFFPRLDFWGGPPNLVLG